jgi:hypothetical protein
MSKRTPLGLQVDAITRFAPQIQESFDLRRLEIGLSTGLGCDFRHYKAMPSPIGKNDRGDYRRSDGVDTITSNGMIYTCAGIFTATMTDNSREQKRSSGGVLDPSESKLVLPRFYNQNAVADGARIYLMPGDRIYFADPNADDRVATAQEMDYQPDVDNEALYPIYMLDGPIVDSRGREYSPGLDYQCSGGKIQWLPGGSNPGIDPNTGKGRIYSIRYLYKAFYYIVALPKEVRITNVTDGGVRGPERMPYHAIIVREYIFHNQNRGDKLNQNKPHTPERVTPVVEQSINPNKYVIPVDMNTIERIENAEDDDT